MKLRIEAQVNEGQNHEHERLQNLGNPRHTTKTTKHEKESGEPPHNTLIHYYYIIIKDKHGLPPTKRLFKVTKLDLSPNSLVHGESLEIRDNHRWYVPSKIVVLKSMTIHLKVITENLSNGEWSSPAGFELARENLKSRIEEEDSITNVENA
ncbi:hypothetical protein Tco_1115282, partial [Tanacetum coccineum]